MSWVSNIFPERVRPPSPLSYRVLYILHFCHLLNEQTATAVATRAIHRFKLSMYLPYNCIKFCCLTRFALAWQRRPLLGKSLYQMSIIISLWLPLMHREPYGIASENCSTQLFPVCFIAIFAPTKIHLKANSPRFDNNFFISLHCQPELRQQGHGKQRELGTLSANAYF